VVEQPPSPHTDAIGPAWLQKLGWPVLVRSVQAFFDDDGSTLAAAVAYFAAFSFFPVLLILLSGLGFVLRVADLGPNEQQAIMDSLASLTSKSLADQVGSMLPALKGQALLGGPLGLLTLLLAAVACFGEIDGAFDRIWRVPSHDGHGLFALLHRVLIDRFKAFVMLVGLGLLIGVLFTFGMVLTTMAQFASENNLPITQLGWQITRDLVGLVMNAVLFMIIYRVVPRAAVLWPDAARGGVLAAVVWEIGRWLLAWYVIAAKYSSAYGVVGSFIAMMVWVYYASTVLFLGAEVVKVLGERRKNSEDAPAA
jgi:membrane protein